MNEVLQEMKGKVESELTGVSAQLKSYVSSLEVEIASAEDDAKSHWIPYLLVAFISAIIGHFF